MRFEWDEDKRHANIVKHRIDFVDAQEVFDGRPVYEYPSSFPHEARIVTVAYFGEQLIAVAWTLREGRVMAKAGNIVSYTAEEIAAMRERGESRSDWAAVDAKTEEELAADTASDPAWDGIPENWYEDAIACGGQLICVIENKQQGRMNAALRSCVEQTQPSPNR